jgi:hypothetical protein
MYSAWAGPGGVGEALAFDENPRPRRAAGGLASSGQRYEDRETAHFLLEVDDVADCPKRPENRAAPAARVLSAAMLVRKLSQRLHNCCTGGISGSRRERNA